LVWIASKLVEKCPDKVFHAVKGSIMQWGVVEVMFTITMVWVEATLKLSRSLLKKLFSYNQKIKISLFTW